MNKQRLLLAAALVAFPAAARAQTDAHADATRPAPTVRVARASGPIRLDGKLDDAAWAAAQPVTAFTQVDPDEGEPASEATEARVLYDDEALYVGVRLADRGKVNTRLGRRDMDLGDSDWFGVVVDSYHGHNTAFSFDVNPSGVRRDAYKTDTQGDDLSWDAVWEAEAQVDPAGGWSAEYRIPFSQLRFNPGERTWGIQLERIIGRRNEYAVFSFTPKKEEAGIARFGHLEGLDGVRTGKRLEVLPYTVAKASYVDPGLNPYREDGERSLSVGVDLKYRVTSNLTLDAAINPDFGQVEVDPAVVNLSAFETVFDEKRPFFVEGSEIFNFAGGGLPSGGGLFYSRRIGGRFTPVGPPTPFADVPTETRILGAAKLSGKTSNGWSLGVLDAVTNRERARFQVIEDGGNVRNERMVVEPLSNYFVGRARKDLRAGQSSVGGMLTAVNRDLETDDLTEAVVGSAYAGGVDFRHQFASRAWVLSGFLAGSLLSGDTTALRRIQQFRPYHYFGRPDADHLGVNGDAGSLAGYSGQLRIAKRAGLHWRGAAGVDVISPGFDVGELGSQRRADRMDLDGSLSYLQQTPGKFFRYWEIDGSARGEWNYDRQHIYNSLFLGSYLQHLNYWSANLNVGATLPSLDDRLTRGGPLARRPGNWRVFTGLNSDYRKALVGNAGFYYQRDDEGGWDANGSLSLTVKSSPRWNLSVGPYFERLYSPAQYIARVADPLAAETFGARYVFAGLTQSIFSIETRFNWTFSPELSLEVYAQPFVTAGKFGAYKELAEPRSYDFRVYGRDVGTVTPATGGGVEIDPDADPGTANQFTVGQFFGQSNFNFRSLRGNAVLRWEWRPGSTLFLVWQQERADAADDVGDFRFGRDRRELFDARPDNVFVIKVNYWLNP
jgi:hypothetical protein